MKLLRRISMLLAGTAVLAACEQEPAVQPRQAEKSVGWRETGGLSGLQKIILNVATDGSALFLAHPYYFSQLEPARAPFQRLTTAAALPRDVSVRIPVSDRFFAYAYHDSILSVARNSAPSSPKYYNLRRLDPTLARINQDFNAMFTCMAFNQQDALLLHYSNSRPGRPYTLLLATLGAGSAQAGPDTLQTHRITIPRQLSPVGGYVRQIKALNTCFLVHIAGEGVFRIAADGTWNKVLPAATVDAIYQWQGNVYAHGEWDATWVSADEGHTWQRSGGVPAQMVLGSYYQVGDSLVGSFRDNLFTVHWHNGQYRLRFLRNDGLQTTQINGLAPVGDSVYVGTSSGLFARARRDFFQTMMAQ